MKITPDLVRNRDASRLRKRYVQCAAAGTLAFGDTVPASARESHRYIGSRKSICRNGSLYARMMVRLAARSLTEEG